MTKTMNTSTSGSQQNVTQLLQAWRQGDSGALDKLIPLVYEELHRLASRYMGRENSGHTLQPTALVNEAYMRLLDARQVEWQNRAHFFAVSAQMMRRILVDFARSRRNLKHGGDAVQVPLDDAIVVSAEPSADLVALDEALKALAMLDPRQAQVVELRYFGGLSIEETAEVLEVSAGTVRRDWSIAQAWLHRELSRGN
jgi:RNA polymerase sigma-70 factor (ECF subfamily)